MMWNVQQYFRKERNIIKDGRFLQLAKSRVKKAHRDAEPTVYLATIWEKSNDICKYVNSGSILARRCKILITVTSYLGKRTG